MVLTAAVRQGIDPDSTYYTSKPLSINVPKYGPWTVKTFGNTYSGSISLTRATLSSDNSVYAQLILDVGPDKVCETAKLLGITTKLDCCPAEGLGGLARGVTPLEMSSAYATLAAGGVRRRPTSIERVEFPDGKSENLGEAKGKRVLTDGEAYEVTKILEQNVQSGTGTNANYRLPGRGQDRHHRRGQGCVVRGLHAQPLHVGLGGLSRCRRARFHGASSPAAPSPPPSGTPSCPWPAAIDCSPSRTGAAELTKYYGESTSWAPRAAARRSGTGPLDVAPAGRRAPPRAGGQPDQEYDPRLYEAPPQPAPTPAPAPEPRGDGGNVAADGADGRRRHPLTRPG